MVTSRHLLIALVVVSALAALAGAGARPARAAGCVELLADGSFETNGAWQLGPSAIVPQYVTYTRVSGNRALALGITSGANVESFSSARQLAAIPPDAEQVVLSFWFYAMADAPATTDYMEVVVLDSGGAILGKPWRSHNDSRLWNQLSFDLSAWRGQTVQIYFNVYNDGLGGTAAMFIDDVSLAACAGALPATPSATPTGTGVPPTVTPTATPGCVDALVNGGFNSGLAYWEAQGELGGIGVVNSPVHGAPYAVKLGSLEQTLNGLASVRQAVTVPAGFSNVTLEAWVYTESQPGAGADYQEIALLNASGSLLFVPWSVRADNRAWLRLAFDVSGFAGQNVFVRFAVNNDGAGGRTAMVVDDARLLACNPGPATATPTRTPTPPATAWPTPTATPVVTLTAVPPGCIELAENGGFELGPAGWIPGQSTLPAEIVGAPVLDGLYALQLGSTVDNRATYSSARQWVQVPWTHPQVTVSFWAYTWAESLGGADRQQFVLLGPGDAVWAVPWKVLEDERAWRQYSFDLIGVAGETVALYFNVINDGAGGRTALFVDEVHAWACTPGAALPASAVGPTAPEPLAAGTAVAGETINPATTPPPDWAMGTPIPREMAGPAATPPPDWTTVAVGGAGQARELSASATPQPTETIKPAASAPTPQAAGILQRLTARWPRGWLVVVLGIVALLILIVLLARPRQSV